jgi:lipopolysaccharide biosynthesis protein
MKNGLQVIKSLKLHNEEITTFFVLDGFSFFSALLTEDDSMSIWSMPIQEDSFCNAVLYKERQKYYHTTKQLEVVT